jgi:tRNA G18 (ribose-2'-O)-methylase SpoU
MGALFRTPVYHTTGLADALRGLRNRFGTAILCADPHGATHIWEAPLSGNVCLVMGNEESGVSPAVREAADALVAIPMAPGVDSLNVGSAAAVFLYEACRQRKARITSRES